MNELDPEAVADLVACIYEAAVEPRHWHELVTSLERIYPESRVTLFGHRDGHPTANLAAAVNYAASDVHDYAKYYIRCSPFIARSGPLPIGKAFHYESLICDDELKRTEYYNDYLRPRRLGHYGTGFIIERPSFYTGTNLSLADHRNDADRRAQQLRLLDLIGPHLQRALHLHRTVAAERARQGAAHAAFDQWAHAALVFDGAGRVVTMNRAAEALIARRDAIWIGRDGTLGAIDEKKARLIEDALRRCAAMSLGSRQRAIELDGIALPRLSGGAPLRVMVWPLTGAQNAVTDHGPGAVLMTIFDPEQVQRTPVGWIAAQFGLSPAEQRLTEAIVNGTPLVDAAEQLGIRLSTARNRLKVIQRKTNCHRQVDLVRLAHVLPAMRRE
jgi:DNA-binding CsgD family transcriptional regulator